MEKALTFEEWLKLLYSYETQPHNKGDDLALLKAARQGVIPEREAVRIPPVSEWPVDAAYIAVIFRTKQDSFAGVVCEDIPRPVQAWVPETGDVVFLNSVEPHKPIYVGVVDGFNEFGNNMFSARFGGDDRCVWTIDRIKPFNASYIGKPWDEIPGGVE